MLGGALLKIVDGFLWCVLNYASYMFGAVFLNFVLQLADLRNSRKPGSSVTTWSRGGTD